MMARVGYTEVSDEFLSSTFRCAEDLKSARAEIESLRARLAEVEGERDEKISRALAKADFESERAGDIENENDALRVEASKHAHDAETVRRERDAAEATVRELREGLATQRAATLREAAAFARKAGDTWSGSRDAMQCVQEAAVDAKCEEIATALEALAGGDA